MKKIFILGSLNMDLVITCPREIYQGETLHGSDFMTNRGGKGANQATACGKLGAEVYMGGCVGSDSFGAELIGGLKACGVNTEYIRAVDNVSSGVAVIIIIDHDNRIILDSGANSMVTEEDIDSLFVTAEEGDIFLTQLENPIDIVGYALRSAKEKGLVTVLNPAPCDVSVSKYLQSVDFFIPNENELAAFTGEGSVETGARKLFAIGVRNVIVTLGNKGYCFVNGKEFINEACIEMDVVDTTAAGDTFCGAFVTRLAVGDTVAQALRFANKAAAITVTRRGAAQSIPTLDEVKKIFG